MGGTSWRGCAAISPAPRWQLHATVIGTWREPRRSATAALFAAPAVETAGGSPAEPAACYTLKRVLVWLLISAVEFPCAGANAKVLLKGVDIAPNLREINGLNFEIDSIPVQEALRLAPIEGAVLLQRGNKRAMQLAPLGQKLPCCSSSLADSPHHVKQIVRQGNQQRCDVQCQVHPFRCRSLSLRIEAVSLWAGEARDGGAQPRS